ncbi:spermidine synthase [Corynebacterium sp. HMSC076C10]|uniref:polyamine aminopropyltransferase n=1 Tax=Corynebacterium sp. HMSC076C10 TaxID=1739361 RepID=UPI0008A1CAF6|nr:polyamine aminopropyltransferase [Corynebacterium sp. HMSC076C10]OFJ58989.1 spermidine synthase [Corynebacterium sp. HMSC076C10]
METTTTSRRWRALLLGSVAACAACGLVYELALLALSASLGRGDVVANSLIVAGYVAALGFGAVAAKPFVRRAAVSFLGIECALGLLGGVSATALYWVFSVTGESLGALVAATFIIGTLVGAEVPLLMTLLQTGRTSSAEDTGRVLANLNAADYFGALVGGLIWPFVLLPTVGMLKATAIAGLINVTAALIIAALLLKQMLTRRALVASVAALVAALVGLVALLAGIRDIEATARQSLYAQPIVFAKHSKYQDIVVTRFGGDRRLYLDGGLQYSSRDEYRYTESLVYPAVGKETKSALILGGGDGLAARELLRMPNIERIVQVDLDPDVIEVARTVLREDNRGSLDNPRVEKIAADAFAWLHEQARGKAQVQKFDAIYADLPDPDNAVLAKLYSQEFYGLIRTVAAPGAKLVVQSGSPFSTPQAFWRTDSSIRAAGWSTTPYHVHVPTFGDWGFVLAQAEPEPPTLELYDDAPPLKFLTPDVARAATVFGADNGPQQLEPSTLAHPRIVEDIRRGWRQAGE